MNLTVYTVLTGNRSELRPPKVIEPGVRYLAFTDAESVPEPWEKVALDPRGLSAQRASRMPKLCPFRYLPDADASIYHDASFALTVYPSAILAALPAGEHIGLHWHPCRSCLYEEAEVLIREKIGTAALVEQQVARYRAARMPERWGLWAAGMIVRRHLPDTLHFSTKWWDEFEHGCERDQIALPYVAWSLNVRPYCISKQSIYKSPFMAYHGHRK